MEDKNRHDMQDENLESQEKEREQTSQDNSSDQMTEPEANEDKKDDKDAKEEDKKEKKIEENLKDIQDRLNEEQDFLERKSKFKKPGMNNMVKMNPFMFFGLIVAIILIMGLAFGRYPSAFNNKQEVTYTEFVNKIKQNEISEIVENEGIVTGIKRGPSSVEVYETRLLTNRLGQDTKLVDLIDSHNIKVNATGRSSWSVLLTLFVSSILPIIIMIALFSYLMKRNLGGLGSGGPGNPFGFERGSSKVVEKPNVKFEDVAGLVEEKEELREIVEFLKNPGKFEKAGARVPKGVLLLGQPGTGKTLLAKAVAGESGATFFSVSGSDFVEIYVGMGAARVRELFKEAKKEKPAIIFIDEIDAVGRKRGQGRHGGNDERESTLNQLLVEMDGFSTDERIIVLAATNRSDVLDSALTRGGRFDRIINVSAPDLDGRVAILKVHTKNKNLGDDVKLEDIAKITPGFVGADLENLLNEAAILAARKGTNVITMTELDEAVDKVGIGLGQKSKIISERDKNMLAYHEGGHALIATLLPRASKVHKVTIIPRGDAGGYMMPLPEETLGRTRAQILAEINVLFAGRAAEELMMDDVATGAYSDIKRATELAKLIVTRVGMNSHLGPVNYEPSEDGFMVSANSDGTNREIDLEIRNLLKEKYEETLNLLKENKDKLENIASLLKAKETVTGSEIRAIVAGMSVVDVLNSTKEEISKFY